MSRDPRYSKAVYQRVADLTGAGTLRRDGQVVSGRAGDPDLGACVEFDLRLNDGVIEEARFRVFGCPHLIASASWLAERLQGAGRPVLEAWDWQEAAEALDVPPAKFGRLLLLQDALRDAAGNWADLPVSTL
jgi:nitrogen fixation NifU-like protein